MGAASTSELSVWSCSAQLDCLLKAVTFLSNTNAQQKDGRFAGTPSMTLFAPPISSQYACTRSLNRTISTMPSLADTLDNLSHHSAQIQALSSMNARPAGQFVQAYLHLNRSGPTGGSVLDLIRDAADSETRLFKFIGDDGGKKVEKREGGVITPLKEMRKQRETGDGGEVTVMLKTALRLVDD